MKISICRCAALLAAPPVVPVQPALQRRTGLGRSRPGPTASASRALHHCSLPLHGHTTKATHLTKWFGWLAVFEHGEIVLLLDLEACVKEQAELDQL